MRKLLSSNLARFLITGTLLVQMGGCDFGMVNSLLQTVLLGISAAGSVVIISQL